MTPEIKVGELNLKDQIAELAKTKGVTVAEYLRQAVNQNSWLNKLRERNKIPDESIPSEGEIGLH